MTEDDLDTPLDQQDREILRRVRAMYEAVDPQPADLLTRIRFAIDLEDLDAELLQVDRTAVPVAVRGERETRTVTFDSGQLTVMVRITDEPDGTLTIDGWLAPAGPHQVELRTPGARTGAVADEQGRFVFTGVHAGLAQFAVFSDRSDPPRWFLSPAVLL